MIYAKKLISTVDSSIVIKPQAQKKGTLEEWKQESGYHRRSLSETAMYRYIADVRCGGHNAT
jgi:hypothetical protein